MFDDLTPEEIEAALYRAGTESEFLPGSLEDLATMTQLIAFDALSLDGAEPVYA